MKNLHDWNHFTTDETIGFLGVGYLSSFILLLVTFYLLFGFVTGNWERFRYISIIVLIIIATIPTLNLVIGCYIGNLIVTEEKEGTSLFLILVLIKYVLLLYLTFKIEIVLFNYRERYSRFNEIKMCSSCGVYHREGYLIISALKGEKTCPTCDSESHFKYTELDIRTNLPLSPKFNFVKCVGLNKLINTENDNKIINDQAEKYVKAQEVKIEKMKEEIKNNKM